MTSIFWVIEYCATFIEAFMCSLFCGTFLKNINLKNYFCKSLFFSFIVSILIIIVNNIILFSPLTTFIFILLHIISQLIIYRKNPLKIPVLIVFFFLISHVFDTISVSSISYIFSISLYEIYEKMSLYRVLAIFLSKSLLIFFTVMLHKFYNKKNNYISVKNLIILFGLSLFTAVLSFFLTFSDIKNKAIHSYNSILIYIIVLVLLVVILFGTFKLSDYYESKQQLNLTKLKNEMLEQSISESEQTFMLWKTSMHDFKHKIMYLITLAENNDMEGIKQYLNEENDLISKTLFYYKTGNDTVDAILYIKQKIAENNSIPFMINASVPEDCNISNEHFASILGNLLDNAIEASLKAENPFVEVKMRDYNGYFWIIVTNKCTDSDISLETSKKDKHLHGIGLKSVKHTIKAYDGELTINKQNEKFEVRIIIPNNKSA